MHFLLNDFFGSYLIMVMKSNSKLINYVKLDIQLKSALTISCTYGWLISNAFFFFESTFLIAIRTEGVEGPYSKFNHQLKENQSNWIPTLSNNLMIWKVLWICFVCLNENQCDWKHFNSFSGWTTDSFKIQTWWKITYLLYILMSNFKSKTWSKGNV